MRQTFELKQGSMLVLTGQTAPLKDFQITHWPSVVSVALRSGTTQRPMGNMLLSKMLLAITSSTATSLSDQRARAAIAATGITEGSFGISLVYRGSR